MKKLYGLSLIFFLITPCFAQDEERDTLKTLDEVTIRAFEQNRKAGSSTSSVKILTINNGDRYNKTSWVNGFNTVSGVRMEERSPGSYRINIRGSSLRSPFGVRNVKVYWNDIPVTDPGGNTYFNQFAYNNFSYLEIVKGPASSLYGAGTGGLILGYNLDRGQPGVSLDYMRGSYDLQNIFASVRFGKQANPGDVNGQESRHLLTVAHNEHDGYRVQSGMRRDNITWQSLMKISVKQQLSASLLFTDMYYQTPGALTLAEYNSNPKAARPAGGGFPSAVNARAAIFQKNLLVGFTNAYELCNNFKNSTTLFGAFNQVKNSAIRNYERRNEPGFGARTLFTFQPANGAAYTGEVENTKQLIFGSEFQQGFFNTQVARNRNGNPDTLQTNDDVRNTTYSLFIQGDMSFSEEWFITGGLSLNKTRVVFTRLSRYPVLSQRRSYKNELAPRVAVKRRFGQDLSVTATVSRGFSPPTIAELLPSTGVISTELEAEYGWNYEMKVNANLLRRQLQLEATGFYFKLNNALVQRRDLSGADFFVNAGDVKQKGLELSADYLKSLSGSVMDHFNIRAAYTYHHFRYGQFVKGIDDFSGKTVPSVPSSAFSALSDVQFKIGVYSNVAYYYASKIFLNDANTASAGSYHLLGWRVGWKKTFQKKIKLNLYGGVDNLLDEKYSLGNDINAAANRFYNAAPRRNYYAGVGFQWVKVSKGL